MKIFNNLIIPIVAVACLGSNAVYGNEEDEISPEKMDSEFSETDRQKMLASFSSAPPLPQLQRSMGDALAGDSNLVIIGEVVDQSYSYGKNDTPSTNTTISISQVIRGAYSSNELTISQKGGPSLSGDGGQMVSGTHHFNVGEKEVLYLTVSANDQVEVDRGFRVFEDKIYSKDGSGIIINSDMSMSRSSDLHPDPSFKTINMGTHVLTKNFSSKPSGNDGDGNNNTALNPTEIVSHTGAVDVNQFIDLIK